MNDLDHGGSDELSEEQMANIEAQYSDLTKEFEKVAQASNEMRAWLNTSLGKAVRKTICINKLNSSQGAVKATTDELAAEARFDYRVWETIERVFTTIIVEGEEAINQLQIDENNYNPQAEVAANA